MKSTIAGQPGPFLILAAFLAGALPLATLAQQQFHGTNQPAGEMRFNFSLASGVTNLTVSVTNTASSFSHLYLKRGDEVSVTQYDHVSRLDGKNNAINLEIPDLAPEANYTLLVHTPPLSQAHGFLVLVDTNFAGLRSLSFPAAKPILFSASGVLNSGQTNVFQVDVPTSLPGWRLVMTAVGTADPDFYIRTGAPPVGGQYTKRSVDRAVDTLFLNDEEATNQTWFVSVVVPPSKPGNAVYTLNTELYPIPALAWDPGTDAAGTLVYTNQSLLGGDHYFRIATLNADAGVWRTRLQVMSSEADLFLRRAAYPTPSVWDYSSSLAGDDGVALAQNGQYRTNEVWYLMVTATPRAQWALWSGNVYVAPLRSPATDAKGGTNVVVEVEGMNFYRTTLSSNTIAWRLGLDGATNQLYVRKGQAAHPYSTFTSDWKQAGQMLLVPHYIKPLDEYFVTVTGSPGDRLPLDSRQQAIQELPFDSATTIAATNIGYATFRVQVPAQQIGWQIDLQATQGNPQFAVRHSGVPNEYQNTAFFESADTSKNITLAPPTLTDGSFYITVYGTPPFAASLANTRPVITDVPYTFRATNDLPGLVGWRYYRITDIDQQLASLGWELRLASQSPGTEIAVRRSGAPGRWIWRTNNVPLRTTVTSETMYRDQTSTTGFLQLPRQAADIWYVGICNKGKPLGPFVLAGRELPRINVPLQPVYVTNIVQDQEGGRFQYFQTVISNEVLGLDLQLEHVTNGLPRLVVCRDILPIDLNNILANTNSWSPYNSTNWPRGAQIAPLTDWTGLTVSADNQNETGHFFFAGRGNPLEPGTYYIGVLDALGQTRTNLMSYHLLVRGLFPEASFNELAFAGGASRTAGLYAHDVSWQRTVVPPNAPSWRLRLKPDVGEGRLVLRWEGLPNYGARLTSPSNLTGCLVQKRGNEHLLLLPPEGASNLVAGTYYLGVVAEGVGPSGSRAGSNTCDLTIFSEGPLPLPDLGTVDPATTTALEVAEQQEGGEVRGFRFAVPNNTPALEVRLKDRTGTPRMSLRGDRQLSSLYEPYGYVDGWRPQWSESGSGVIHIQNPVAGTYTLLVQASSDTNATYTVAVSSVPPVPVAFDGGSMVITNHPGDTWRYFLVTVPEDALGWDFRLTHVLAGEPRLAICREWTPMGMITRTTNGSSWAPYTSTNWPSGWQFAPEKDSTGADLSSDGRYQSGQVFAAGLRNPLDPGRYIVGVANRSPLSGTNLLAYTAISRGIGTNSSITVAAVDYESGWMIVSNLPPREAAYFSVQVPTNAPHWQVRLGASPGDALMLVRKDGLPNAGAASVANGNPTNLAGIKLMKTGREHFVLLPDEPLGSIPAGTYYLAAVSQGVNPVPPQRVGSNVCHVRFDSIGPLPIEDLGELGPFADSLDAPGELDGGEIAAYRFDVPPNTLGLFVELVDRAGEPAFTLRADTHLARSFDPYGRVGGWTETWKSTNVVVVSRPPPGSYTLLTQAGPRNNEYPHAAYSLIVSSGVDDILDFDGGSRRVVGQPGGSWSYFIVQVPPDATGWDLRLLSVTSGDPRMVICNYGYPSDLTSRAPSGTAWDWGKAGSWPIGYQAAPLSDWTALGYSASGQSQTGRVFAIGMGNPLQPGTYVVGVTSPPNSLSPMAYTIQSRGIGGKYSIPVVPLPSAPLATATNRLEDREAAYYQVEVPAGLKDWKLKLAPATGDVVLVVQKGFLPNIAAASNTVATTIGGGRRLHKPGNEHFLVAPAAGLTNLSPGTYYLGVISQGGNPDLALGRTGTGVSESILSSWLPGPRYDLGTVDPRGADVVITNAQQVGETVIYQFYLAADATRLDVNLENPPGNPFLRLRADSLAAVDGLGYGQEGGWMGQWEHTNRLSVMKPAAGSHTLTLFAGTRGGVDTPATYRLRVHAESSPPVLTFDAGRISVTNQGPDLWKFFQVVVPTNAIGWDLRLTNVTSGNPRLAICRDNLPRDLNTHRGIFALNHWPSNAQIAPVLDWTDSNGPSGSSETGRVFQVGMSNPLQPGTYYVGVTNSGSIDPMSYTIASRGIGPRFSIPVVNLPFANGLVSVLALPAREVSWYRVEVPPNLASWKLRVGSETGDCLLLAQKDSLPGIGALPANAVARVLGGRKMRKAGNEHLLLLASGDPAKSQVPSGTYFVGVVSEGRDPNPVLSRIGNGDAGFQLWSAGISPPLNLGVVGPQPLVAQAALEGGEAKTWRFSVGSNVLAVELSVEDALGLPLMGLSPGSYPPGLSNAVYGLDGGDDPRFQSARVITLPNPSSPDYSFTVQASGSGITYPDAACKIRLRPVPTPWLNFDAALNTNGASHAVANLLGDSYRAYSLVRVPPEVGGKAVIGWKLNLSARFGLPLMRIRKGALPDDTPGSGTSGYFERQAVFVPDYLTPGDWYVEVKASGLCSYTLESYTLELVRPAWVMPARDQPVTTPGLPPRGPAFGDTAVDTAGVPVASADGGIDLEQDSFHSYAVAVPEDNAGLLRTQLEAISGNPNLYLRYGAPPTLSHNAIGTNGPLYDRALTNSIGTEYGNWVPLNGQAESALTPGTWYLAVQAASSSVRYRLRLSVGNIVDLPFAGGSASGQELAAGDWRYFRVALPTNMVQRWTLNLTRHAGDLVMHVRDTLPPGNGLHAQDFVDWADDQKNHGPYLAHANSGPNTLTVPPLRPGDVYYLGFRAAQDSRFSLASVPGQELVPIDAVVPFAGGVYAGEIPAFGVVRLRVDVPPDARRWQQSAIHSSNVKLFLDQGSIPTMTAADHWFNSAANSTLNALLYASSWPWLPGFRYYLAATNLSASPEPFTIVFDGRNCLDDDFDEDRLPDCWEVAWFGSIYTYGPESDPDGDGLANAEEFARGSDPTADNPLQMTEPRLHGDGTFSFRFQGAPNRTYTVQSSSSLDMETWVDEKTFFLSTPEQSIEVPTAPNAPLRFYRVVAP